MSELGCGGSTEGLSCIERINDAAQAVGGTGAVFANDLAALWVGDAVGKTIHACLPPQKVTQRDWLKAAFFLSHGHADGGGIKEFQS